MAGPIRTMLQRRPVRNAVRMLLGMDPIRPGMRNMPQRVAAATRTQAPSTLTPLASVAAPAKSQQVSALTTTVSPPPATPMAPAVQPRGDAMAVASDTNLDAPPTRLPPRAPVDEAVTELQDASMERARSGLFANLPPRTPTPKTTGMSGPVKTLPLTPAAARQTAVEAAAGAVVAPEPVSQTPAQQIAVKQPGTYPQNAQTPATPDKFAARLAQASALRQRSEQLYERTQQMAGQWNQKPTKEGMVVIQQGYMEAKRLADQADRTENLVFAERQADRQFAQKDKEIDANLEAARVGAKQPDTLAANANDFATVVKQQGVNNAVLAAMITWETGLQGIIPDDAQRKTQKARFSQMAGTVALADRMDKGQAPAKGDPLVAELAQTVYDLHPSDPQARARAVNAMVQGAGTTAGLSREGQAILVQHLNMLIEAAIKELY